MDDAKEDGYWNAIKAVARLTGENVLLRAEVERLRTVIRGTHESCVDWPPLSHSPACLLYEIEGADDA
jgi:hypothetical protein